MFKTYRKFTEAQYTWIRNNPGQYLALNAILLVPVIGYTMYQDRKLDREIKDARTQHNL